jgi:predicted N-acetyltransferase YhbS
MPRPSAPLIVEQLAGRPDLLPTVARWIFEEWWEGTEGASLNGLTDLLRLHLTPDQIPMTLIALHDSRPVGTATLLAHDVGTEQWPQLSPWLAAVYVVPECRHKGIGARLVNEVVAEAAGLGAAVLYLLTTEREDFYARLGWQVFERTAESVVMSHGLAASP